MRTDLTAAPHVSASCQHRRPACQFWAIQQAEAGRLPAQVGCAEVVARVVEDLKDESEPYRRMVMETIDKVVRDLGTADVDARLEELLIDGILYAFQEQVSDDANVMLNGFGTVVNSLKMRAKPYLPQICGTIKWRLNNKSAKIRQQAADLIARIAIVMKVGDCAIHCPGTRSEAFCLAASLQGKSPKHIWGTSILTVIYCTNFA